MTVDVDRIMKQNTLMNSRSFELLPTVGKGETVLQESLPIAPNNDTQLPNEEDPISPGSPLSPLCSQTNIETDTFNNNYNNNYSYPLIRKKSGELVKSSLKLNNAFEASGAVSLPSTPTYKQVHFGNNIAIRYFDQKDKPNSISADNSPYNSDLDDSISDSEVNTGMYSDDEDADPDAEGTDSVDYYGFSQDDGHDSNDFNLTRCFCEKLYKVSKKLVESETALNTEKFKNVMKNWNLDTSQFKSLSYRDQIDCEVPVFLERCFLNLDKTLIVGQIAVKNISFIKIVKIRYSFDNWFTIVNVDAKYTSDIPRVLKRAGYDRFLFQLSTPVLLSMYFKTNPNFLNSPPNFEFCIKYTAGGQDFWDNNHSRNYRLSFNHNNFLKLNKTSSPTPKKTTPLDDSYFSLSTKNVKQSKDLENADPQNPSAPSPSNYIPNQAFSSQITSSNQMHPRSASNSSSISHTSSIISPAVTLKKSRSFDRRNSVKNLIGSPEFLMRDNDNYKSNGNRSSDNNEPNSIDLNRGGLKNNFRNSGNQLPSSNSQLRNENENILVKLKELELNPKEFGKTTLALPMKQNSSSSSSKIINGNNPTMKSNLEYPSLENREGLNGTVENLDLRKPSGGADTENGDNNGERSFQPGWKGVDSETYKDLLEKYCFFKGPSTVSSFLADEQDLNGNNLYDDKFY
ncbi:hypothetical protein PMKS-003649 [Pichia membranifaciens]|uniref:CBM21 domain-containing protein n=1 Tax=Pichia membranifaciens TaxID=4926 RepID=A0A1Q2YKT0_9ASCO|nr:hypothetical protein PMKS-003649 [Pichia membranifaciens]